MFNSSQPHGLQHTGLLCPPLSPSISSDLCPLSWWCHQTIAPFSSCPQSFPASGSFPVGRLSASGGQNIGASASVLPMNFQGWFPLGLTGSISLLSKGLESSPPQFESISSLMRSLFYGPTLISIHAYWKNHSFDYTDLCGQIFFSKISEYLNQVQCSFCWGIQDLSSLIRDRTCTTCIGRRSLNHWDTRELHLLLTF